MTIDLRLGDCLELMRDLPDCSVDAVITDPPYGIGENNRKNLARANLAAAIDYGDFEWDKHKLPRCYIDELRRVSRNQVLWGGQYYAEWLPSKSCWLVWDKDRTGDFADCELAWTSYDKAVRKFKWRWNGFLKEKPEQRFHPTQKPLALMEWVIKNNTKEGDTVLDPFMGSGTTGVACVKLNRNFIGMEINPDYFAIAQKRIAEAQKQLSFSLA